MNQRNHRRRIATAAALLGLATLGTAGVASAQTPYPRGGQGYPVPEEEDRYRHEYGVYDPRGTFYPYDRAGEGDYRLDARSQDLTRADVRRLGSEARTFDRDRDGRLTGNERTAAARFLQARQQFNALDRDRDGRLFRNETRGWLRSHFDQLDLNDNLSLTRAEVDRALLQRYQQQSRRYPYDQGRRTYDGRYEDRYRDDDRYRYGDSYRYDGQYRHDRDDQFDDDDRFEGDHGDNHRH